MSVDLTAGPGGSGQQPTDDEVIDMAKEAIEVSRDELRRGRDAVLSTDLQQPGVTVDLGHRSIVRLPDEVIDIIKDEIERLAISHNRVASFPDYISECKRLRYLNARYNALRDFPAPILQLSSLEILDLSRNRIRKLPEDIRNLSSLKVLAVQKNRIERLPLSIGDMSSLRMLKLDDNPIIFPPEDVLQLDPTSASNASGNEVEALLTTQIKKYLKQASNAASNRQRLQVESDGEVSEDAMETPRPPRPAGTRFPVRPSISGLESLGIPTSSVSPEALSTPALPLRSHRRLRSNQPAALKRTNLLSPPEGSDRSAMNGDEASDITVRPKRHGIVTPKVTNTPRMEENLPQSAPMEATIDELAEGDLQDKTQEATTPIRELKQSVEYLHFTIYRFASDIQEMVRSFDWGKENWALRVELTEDADATFKTIDKMNDVLLKMGTLTVPKAVEELDGPMLQTYDAIEVLARFINTHKDFLVEREASGGAACTMLYQALWNTSCTLKAFGDIVQQLTIDPSGEILRPEDLTRLSFTSKSTRAGGNSANSSFSIARSSRSNTSSRQTMREGDGGGMQMLDRFLTSESDYLANNGFSRQNEDNAHFEQIVRVHKMVVERGNQILPIALEKLKEEREVAANYYGDDHTVTRSIGLMISRFDGVIQAVRTLDQRIASLNLRDPTQRTDRGLWKDFRRPGAEWSHALDLVANLGLPTVTNDVKTLCKPLHAILKEATRLVAESPWATAAYDNTRGPQNGENPNFYMPGSIPSTPLSAAIGPIASAAVNPVTGTGESVRVGPSRTGSSTRINFFERADEYQRNTANRRI